MKINKTNAVRLLDKAKIAYELIPVSYTHLMCIRDRISGIGLPFRIAEQMNILCRILSD